MCPDRRRAGALVLAVSLGLTGAREGRAEGQGSPLGDLVVRAALEASIYDDSDSVTVVTPTVSGSVEDPLSGWTVGGRYLVDVVTAASADIVATATPAWTEVRHMVSASAGYKPGDLGGALQLATSSEPDYLSLTIGGTGTLDLYEKNVTLLLGYAYGHDTSGRAETSFDVFSHTVHKHTLNAGVTLVAGPSTLMTVVGDVVLERGDSSKPYRYVPMFEPGTADDVPVGASFAYVARERAFERPREQLPLERRRFAATFRVAHRFAGATLRMEERLYADSWDLVASTSDVRYALDLGPRLAVWPHVRVHLQGGVDFWRRAYELSPDGAGRLVAPPLRTGDRELGPMRSFTGGLGAEIDLSERPGSRAWVLTLQTDGVLTHYLDTLYIVRRNALFSGATVEAMFE